jgi:hypothetical protein
VVFADLHQSAIQITAKVAAMVLFLGSLGAFALVLFRTYERFARKALEQTYEGFDIHTAPRPGDVVLVYHTYHGFLAWHTETTHRVFLPAYAARELLGRLLRFNLTWGLLVHGGVFVPPVAISNYIAQRRSISKQETEAAFAPTLSIDAVTKVLAKSRGPSLVRRLFGWIMLVLCVLFGVTALFALASRAYDAFFGGAVLALLLAWTARDWLSTGPSGAG